jgi:hypothetical protein
VQCANPVFGLSRIEDKSLLAKAINDQPSPVVLNFLAVSYHF